MELSLVEPKHLNCAFSPAAAKLFESPAPYVATFEPDAGASDCPYPRLIISNGEIDPDGLSVRLAGESEQIGGRPARHRDIFPLWPVAWVEPRHDAQRLVERFMRALPDRIREGLVRIPAAADVTAAAHRAVAQNLAGILTHSVATDSALVQLRRLHEDTQRAFRELEEYVVQHTDLDTSLPPVRLPGGHQSLRLQSGSTVVQRLVASSYRLAGVEIEAVAIPSDGGRLTAVIEREDDGEPWLGWELDLDGRQPGAMLFRLKRVSMEPSAGIRLRLHLDLVNEQQHLALAATAPQALREFRAQISGPAADAGAPPTAAIAHTVHRGWPSTRYGAHAAEILGRSLEREKPPQVAIVRADFARASLLSPPKAVVDKLMFPVIAEAPGELQVHPVMGQLSLAAIPMPSLSAGSVLRVPVRMAHEQGRDVLVRLLYGPADASKAVLRLLPRLLGKQDSQLLDELGGLGLSATGQFTVSGKQSPSEISLPIAFQAQSSAANTLYVALRTAQERDIVDFCWFRIRPPRSYTSVEHGSGEP